MLTKYLVLLFLIVSFLDADNVTPDSNNKAKMIEAFTKIREILEIQYAPLEWKESHLGWSLHHEVQKVEERIRSTPQIKIKNFQHYIKNFLLSLQDFHLNISFYSTEAAFIPLMIKSAEGRYFINHVYDYLPLSATLKKIQPGDEILTINGIPTAKVVQDFLDQEFHQGLCETDRSMGEYFFFSREGALGHIIPQGKLILEIKHMGSNKKVKYPIEWIYISEKIPHVDLPKPKAEKLQQARTLNSIPSLMFPLNKHEILKKLMSSPLATRLHKAGELGAKDSFLPHLGKVVWETSGQLDIQAYIFQTPTHRRIGFLRIPHYSLNPGTCDLIENILLKFSIETEALIIDQTNNHGGLVFQMYQLASMLIDRPFTLPYHRISLTQKEISFAVEAIPALQRIKTLKDAHEIVGTDLDGYPITLEIARNLLEYFQDMVSEWHAGKQITEPLPLWGIRRIDPHQRVRYTKPLLILINELDFSCADLFPAIMQDNKRATLFGCNTAGAGGFVLGMEFPNLLGIETMTYTGSVAERANLTPIENLGVTADIPYKLKCEDLMHSYRSYVHEVNQAIENLFH